MLIDFHTHIFPDKIAPKTIETLAKNGNTPPYSDGTLSGLVACMGRADASVSVALPVLTNPASFESINRFAVGVNSSLADKKRRIISFGAIHPDCDDIEGKLRQLKELGFLGVKLHPEYQNTDINADGNVKIIRAAAELDMIVSVHAGVDGAYRGLPVRCRPDLVLDLLSKVSHPKLVLAHLGGNELFGEVAEKLCGKNVYFDTAYVLRHIDKDTFMRIYEKHGEDKILFATDSPWSDIAEDADILRSYGLGATAEQKILGGNAQKLLNL